MASLLVMDDLKKELENFIEVENFRDKYKTLPCVSVIYIFLFCINIDRLEGSSTILKIGETMNFKKRMMRYFNVKNIKDIELKPKRQTAYRLRKFVDENKGKVTLWYKEYPNYSKKCLRCEEKRLLKLYLNEHLETPPLNMGMS